MTTHPRWRERSLQSMWRAARGRWPRTRRRNPANVRLEWTVTGPDADDFRIDQTGRLYFQTPPDYEDPNNLDHEYEVTVQASDGTVTGELPVLVTVRGCPGYGPFVLVTAPGRVIAHRDGE